MLNMTKWTGLILVAALSGCAGVEQQGSFERGAGLLGDGSGYQPLVMVKMPLSTCDHPAFVLGFKHSYVQRWNQQVNAKIIEYTEATSKPQSGAAAQNKLALYKSRLIGASAEVGQAAYTSRCPAESYKNGQAEGARKADENLNLLAQQDPLRTP